MKEPLNQMLTRDEPGSIGVSMLRVEKDQKLPIEDHVAIEEPLEIVLNHGDKRQTVSITMRTPINDPELVMGFLYAEGIIQSVDDVSGLSYWGPKVGPLNIHNTLVVDLRRAPGTDLKRLERNFFTHAGCGICGKTALEALVIPRAPALTTEADGLATFESTTLRSLPEKMRNAQNEFERTGGLHASAMFDTQGNMLSLFEDIGRHNAMDKLVGSLLQSGSLPIVEGIVVVSGRASFELVQKALMANFSIFVSVGAPSSLALDLAKEYDLTLIGFTSENSLNIYNGNWRVN
jgi:FdhD protein